MNTDLPIELVRSWPHAWRNADLWLRIVGTPSGQPTDAEWADLALEALSGVEGPEQIFELLLQRGAFRAASELLDHEGFTEALISLRSGLVDVLKHRLEDARRQEKLRISVRLENLRFRFERLGRRDAALEKRLREIDKCFTDSRIAGELVLKKVETELSATEQERASALRSRLQQLLASSVPESQALRAAEVETCIESGDFLSAAEILEGRSAPADRALLPPPLAKWIFSDAPGQVCEWLLGRAPAPRDAGPWRLRPEATTDRTLIEALRDLLQISAAAPNAESVVTRFTRALAALLELPEQPPLKVQRDKGVLRATLHGLHHWSLPALSAALYPNGLPLLFPLQSSPGQQGRQLQLVFAAQELLGWPDHFLRITPTLLFQLTRTPVPLRAMQFRRAIGAQIPGASAMPAPSPADPSQVLLGREELLTAKRELGVVTAVVGPAGIGKTALLIARERMEKAAGGQPLTIRQELPSAAARPGGVKTLLANLQRAVSDLRAQAASPHSKAIEATSGAPLPGRGSLVILDGVVERHLKTPAEIRELVAALHTLIAKEPRPLRFLFTAAPALLADPKFDGELDILFVGPLSPQHTRILAQGRLDALGLSFDPEALDDIAYYCAGNPLLLTRLLAEIVQRHSMYGGQRRRRLTRQDILSASLSESYVEDIKDVFLSPLADPPLARFVLGALIDYAREDLSAYGVSLGDLQAWLELIENPQEPRRLTAALRMLCLMGLLEWIEPGQPEKGVRLPRTGVAQVVLRHVVDPEGYTKRAAAELAGQKSTA